MTSTAMGRDATEAGVVTVHGSAAGFAQTIVAGRHVLTADEPISVGGTETDPAPYDLVLAALGSCTPKTVAMYARRKSWPLEAVTLRPGTLRFTQPTVRRARQKKVDSITSNAKVGLIGVLNEDQRARLLDIANKCPVHRRSPRRSTSRAAWHGGIRSVGEVMAWRRLSCAGRSQSPSVATAS